jgi:hypothetical protein
MTPPEPPAPQPATPPTRAWNPTKRPTRRTSSGADGETRILIDKVLARKLTLLFAGSGIGKSSLLQAALPPPSLVQRPRPTKPWTSSTATTE